MTLFQRSFLISFLAFFFAFIPFKDGNATHLLGADITYKCLGNGKYQVVVSLYRDCGGLASEPPDVDVFLTSDDCGIDTTLNIDQDPVVGDNDVTPFCEQIDTECGSGTFAGVEVFTYTDTFQIPAKCPDWEFHWSDCCRNGAAITTIDPDNPPMHTHSTLNNQDFGCNSSPDFSDIPAAFVCLDDTTCYNPGAFDPEGDSLVYSLVTPTTGQGSGDTVNYIAGYDSVQFLKSTPPITIDSSTGDLCLSPDQIDVSVMELKIEQYQNDSLVGSVHRDIQFRVVDCSSLPGNSGQNDEPYFTGINGFGSYDTIMCEDDSMYFDIPGLDSNSSDSLVMDWNQGITGASFDTNSTSDTTVTGHFSWAPDSSDGGQNHCFTVRVRDGACPFPKSKVRSFCIDVASKADYLKNLDISYGSGTFCYDADTVSPLIKGDTLKNGTFWSEPAGLDIDTNGVIDPSNSAADSSYMVYYETSDSLLCQGIDSVPITIDSNQIADFHYPDTFYCETGDTVAPTFLNGGSHGIFSSSDPAKLKVDSIYGIVDIQASQEGTYWVYNKIPASGSCPEDLDSAKIIIEDLPTTDVSPERDTICITDPYPLNGTYGGGTSQITWSTFGDGTFSDVNDTSAVYDPGSNDKNSGSVQILIESDSIKYCPADEDTMELTIEALPTLDVGKDDTICADAAADVAANIGGSAKGVQWNSTGDGFFDDSSSSVTSYHPGGNDKSSGTVTLYARTKGSVCPSVEDSLELTVLPLPDPSFSYPTQSVCEDGDKLTPTIQGDSGGVFTANPPGGLDLDSSTGEIDPSNSYDDYYTVTYTVGDQCPNDTTITFTVKPKPSAPSPDPLYVCPGETGELSPDGAPDSVVWYNDANGNNVVGTDSVFTPDPQNISQPGVYTYYVKVYKNGCVSPLGSVDVTVNDYADVDIIPDPDPAVGVKPFTVTFKNGSGTNVVDFDINFGNGTAVSDSVWSDTSVTYPKKGSYKVTMNAVDTVTGCFGSDQLIVEVVEEAQAQLPNVFTPNGDGKNELFMPTLGVPCPDEKKSGKTCWNGVKSFKGTIFNRWGNKVYQWSDWENPWDGGNSPEGTYYYVIKATGENGEKVEFKGQVSLLRKED